MSEKISVIVPAYNAEKYISRCIESILNQTYKNIEVIVINDGSKDKTAGIIDTIAANDPRVVPVHQENKGAALARQAGIMRASGEYITFVDSDDYIDNDMLLYLYMLINSGDYQISCCKYKTVRDGNENENDNTPENLKSYNFEGIIKNLYPENFWSIWGKLYRRELFGDSTAIIKSITVGEDLLMAYSLYRNCNKAVVSDRKLYYYFRHGESVMAQELNEKHIHDSMTAYRIIAADMNKSTKAYEYHIQNLLSNDFGFLNSIILKNTCRECYTEIRKEILYYKKYAFKNRDNPALNNRHRLGVILLSVCPKLFDLSIKIKG